MPSAQVLKLGLYSDADYDESHANYDVSLVRFASTRTDESRSQVVVAAFVNFTIEVLSGKAKGLHAADHPRLLKLLLCMPLGPDGLIDVSSVASYLAENLKHDEDFDKRGSEPVRRAPMHTPRACRERAPQARGVARSFSSAATLYAAPESAADSCC